VALVGHYTPANESPPRTQTGFQRRVVDLALPCLRYPVSPRGHHCMEYRLSRTASTGLLSVSAEYVAAAACSAIGLNLSV